VIGIDDERATVPPRVGQPTPTVSRGRSIAELLATS
jgi:hypothetical protein